MSNADQSRSGESASNDKGSEDWDDLYQFDPATDVGNSSNEKVKSNKHRMKLEQRKQQKLNQQKPSKSSVKKKEKAAAKQKLRLESAKAGFSSHHRNQFGDRWTSLLAALEKPTKHCALINKYCDKQFVEESLSSILADLTQLPFVSIPTLAFTKPPDAQTKDLPFPAPKRDESGITNYYLLDAASLLPVEMLDVQPYDSVLDLCAAPGGKALAILQKLNLGDAGGSLTCNELSPDRRKRLKNVIQSYLPQHLQSFVTITGRDATKWHQLDATKYDKVLVDAPCSSDRHLLHDETELASWTPGRVRANAKRQFSILFSALRAVRFGGIVVYATCALSHEENDDVIEKVLKKSKLKAIVIRPTVSTGEQTKYGWIVLPDSPVISGDGSTTPNDYLTTGWGPLYFATLRIEGMLAAEDAGMDSDASEESDDNFVDDTSE